MKLKKGFAGLLIAAAPVVGVSAQATVPPGDAATNTPPGSPTPAAADSTGVQTTSVGGPPDAPTSDATTPASVPADSAIQVTASQSTLPVASVQAGAKPAASSSRIVQEIVVTAEKREESLQSVPIAISAFSADQLDARGVTGIKDLGIATPSLQFTDFAGYTLIYLRGVGTDTFIPSADPSVATYLDGVYFPSAHSLGESFGALERVEILKGPQGTLFGRNSTGGAINVITKKPSHDFETSVQVSYGRFNDLKTRLNVNVPIGRRLSVGLSGFYNIDSSYYKQDAPGLPSELPHDISNGGRIKIAFDPIDELDIQLTGLTTRQQGGTAAVGVNTQPSLLGTLLGIQPEKRNYVSVGDNSPYVKTDIKSYYGQITYNAPWVDVKAIGSYFNIKTSDYKVDFDGSSVPLVTSQSPDEFQLLRSAELQILSNHDSPGASWLKYIAGFYFFDSKGGYNPVTLSAANSVVNLPTGQVVSLIPKPLLDLLSFVPGPTGVRLDLYGAVGTVDYSGYFQTTITPLDWIDVTLGGRYQAETRRLTESNVEIKNIGGTETSLIDFAPRQTPTATFSPKATIDLHVIDNTLLYASFSRGYKSATYNIVNLYQQPEFVNPEKVTAYEVGAKTALFDNALRINTAIFENNISNLQVSFVSLLAGGAVQFQNAGSARVRGGEVDATWIVLPNLDPGLVFTTGGSYLQPIYTSFKNGSGFDPPLGLYSTNNDFTGHQIARVPRFTGNLGLSQTVDVPGGTLEASGEFYHNSGFYFLAQNTPNSHESAYDLVNARLSYLYKPWDVRLTAFGTNLTNTHYRVSQFFTDFGRLDTLAPPVEFGMRLNWDF